MVAWLHPAIGCLVLACIPLTGCLLLRVFARMCVWRRRRLQMLQGLQTQASARLKEVQEASEGAAARHRAQMAALQALAREALAAGDLTILMQGARARAHVAHACMAARQQMCSEACAAQNATAGVCQAQLHDLLAAHLLSA